MPPEYMSFDFQPLILSLKACKHTVITKSCYKGSRAPQFGWIYTVGLDTQFQFIAYIQFVCGFFWRISDICIYACLNLSLQVNKNHMHRCDLATNLEKENR